MNLNSEDHHVNIFSKAIDWVGVSGLGQDKICVMIIFMETYFYYKTFRAN